MPAKTIAHPTVADRRAKGADARIATPLESHGGWRPRPDRFDPVSLLEDQNANREADLVPVRHGRMAVSPFTFYRGAAKIMAADLASTPTAGLDAQLCGDAHLSNFGGFASPERRLLFDLNDFDETLPGPVEFDVKRMAASFVIAARNNGLTPEQARSAALASVRAYRQAMVEFADMGTMQLWYTNLSEDDLRAALAKVQAATKMAKSKSKNPTAKDAKAKGAKAKDARAKDAKGNGVKAKAGKGAKDRPDGMKGADLIRAARTAEKGMTKARTRDSLQALSKLGELVDGRYRIISQPPVVVPLRDIPAMYQMSTDDVENATHQLFREYRTTLEHDRRHLLEEFEVIDMARKVVGVGSVGTRAFILLLQGRDAQDPLFLQVKEATSSVLEDHLPKSAYRNPGERVVRGQRMMQAASDIFLGWSKGVQEGRYYYWRQLRDMKMSADIENMTAFGLEFYAGLCGWTLARAHARSGDAVALASYLGEDDTFDRSITDFSERYADQNERDYEAFTSAIASGRIEAIEGV